MLYHVSATPGLKILQPRISSHGKAYVYAIDNLVTGLLFGAKKDDFDFLLDVDKDDTPVIYECYPDAFSTIYRGKRCSVYELMEEGFLRGVTGWDPELVRETEAAVEKEYVIPDLYARLLEEEAKGNLIIHRYRQDPEYQEIISEHIKDRLIRFDLLEYFDTKDIRGEKYYRAIIDELKKPKTS